MKIHYFQIYIDCLSTKEDYKIAKKYIVKNNLDLDHYPQIKHFAELSFFSFFFKEFTWEQCEERFAHKKTLLVQLSENLYMKNSKNEAFSIIKRHDLWKNPSFFIDKAICEEFEKNSKDFVYVSNRLFEENRFAPFEVVYYKENEENYLTLKGFGFEEKDICFVNEENHVFFEAFQCLFSSKIVNFLNFLSFFCFFFGFFL